MLPESYVEPIPTVTERTTELLLAEKKETAFLFSHKKAQKHKIFNMKLMDLKFGGQRCYVNERIPTAHEEPIFECSGR